MTVVGTYSRLLGRPLLVYTTRPNEEVPPVLAGVLVAVDHDDGFLVLECRREDDNARLAKALGASAGMTVYLRQKHVVMAVPISQEDYDAAIRA